MVNKQSTRYYDRVPELSLARYLNGDGLEKREFMERLFDGLKYFGFIILKDHPIDKALLAKSYSLSRQLFGEPEAKKKTYISPSGGGQRGYTPFGREHAKDASVPDLKEFWHVGAELDQDSEFFDQYPKNIWPDVPEFRETFLKLYSELNRVGQIMLRALAPSLNLPLTYFDSMIEDGNSILRLLHYPPIAEGTDPRCIRAAAHEDINLITILVAASTSGLQLLSRDGQWLPVETEADNLIVDAGDMLARITNDVIPSTTHRVINPQDGKNVSRYSMPFFIHPNPKAMLTCIESCKGDEGPKYPDILAQEFLVQRLREIGLM